MEGTKFFPTVYNIWINEGITGYYKGVWAPLVSVPFLNAVIFASFEISRKVLRHIRNKEQLDLIDVALAGAVAGVCNTVIVTPIELIKCKMQMQKNFRKYKNSLECITKLVMKNGVRGRRIVIVQERFKEI